MFERSFPGIYWFVKLVFCSAEYVMERYNNQRIIYDVGGITGAANEPVKDSRLLSELIGASRHHALCSHPAQQIKSPRKRNIWCNTPSGFAAENRMKAAEKRNNSAVELVCYIWRSLLLAILVQRLLLPI